MRGEEEEGPEGGEEEGVESEAEGDGAVGESTRRFESTCQPLRPRGQVDCVAGGGDCNERPPAWRDPLTAQSEHRPTARILNPHGILPQLGWGEALETLETWDASPSARKVTGLPDQNQLVVHILSPQLLSIRPERGTGKATDEQLCALASEAASPKYTRHQRRCRPF